QITSCASVGDAAIGGATTLDIENSSNLNGSQQPISPSDEVTNVTHVTQESQPGESKPQVDRLVTLARVADYFHTPDRKTYATILTRNHLETWPIRSAAFRSWLVIQYRLKYRRIPDSSALTTALEHLAAEAEYVWKECQVHVRVGEFVGRVYLDLG